MYKFKEWCSVITEDIQHKLGISDYHYLWLTQSLAGILFVLLLLWLF